MVVRPRRFRLHSIRNKRVSTMRFPRTRSLAAGRTAPGITRFPGALPFLKACLAALALGLLAGCAGGPVKRVSEPAMAIQELEVRADGTWRLALRLQNFSSVPMRFERIALQVEVDGIDAGRLTASPDIDVGPESADSAMVEFVPNAQARIAVATALAEGRPLPYVLDGDIAATAREGRSRDYQVRRRSALNPVPGLPGVLR